MSKPSEKKALRQRRKNQQRKTHQPHKRGIQHSSSLLTPDFPAERVGAPAAGASWIGKKIAAFLRIR
jgi:hypothetical protein